MISRSCGVATSCQDMKFSQCWLKQHVVSWELLKFAVSLLCTRALLQGVHRALGCRNLPLSWPQVSLRVLSVTCGNEKQDGSYFSARPCPAKPMGPGTLQWSQQEGIIGRRRALVLLVVLVQVNWGVRTEAEGQNVTGRTTNPDNTVWEEELQFPLQLLLLSSKWVLKETRELRWG